MKKLRVALLFLCSGSLWANYTASLAGKQYTVTLDTAYSLGTVSVGDLVIIWCSYAQGSPTNTFGSVTSGLGNTITELAGSPWTNATNTRTQARMYQMPVTTGGSDTITFHSPTNNADIGFIAVKVTGLVSSNQLDALVAVTNPASTSTPTSGSLTTSATDYLIAFWADEVTNPGTQSTGTIAGVAGNNEGFNAGHWDFQEDSGSSGAGQAAGTYTASITNTNASNTWVLVFAGFKVAGTSFIPTFFTSFPDLIPDKIGIVTYFTDLFDREIALIPKYLSAFSRLRLWLKNLPRKRALAYLDKINGRTILNAIIAEDEVREWVLENIIIYA